MAKTFIREFKSPLDGPGERFFVDQAVAKVNANRPFVGSMKTISSGTATIKNIYEDSVDNTTNVFERGIHFFTRAFGGRAPSDEFVQSAQKRRTQAREREKKREFKEIGFQFFPETIKDDRTHGFEEANLPGASDPIVLFGSVGVRTLSFTVRFAQERMDTTELASNYTDSLGKTWDKYNFDVATAVQVMRGFTYPLRIGIAGTSIVPQVQAVRLRLPGTGIGIREDSIVGLVKSYSAEYKAFFPNGKPRVADVAIVFQEVPALLPQNFPFGLSHSDFVGVIDRYDDAQRNALVKISTGWRTRETNVVDGKLANPPKPFGE